MAEAEEGSTAEVVSAGAVDTTVAAEERLGPVTAEVHHGPTVLLGDIAVELRRGLMGHTVQRGRELTETVRTAAPGTAHARITRSEVDRQPGEIARTRL